MRRFAADPDFRAGFAEMLPACVGMIPFGLVCGVGAAATGASVLGALGLSAIVFSGAAQVLAVQLLAAGAPLAVVVLTCFVAGLRFVIYSAAMAPYLRPLPARWQQGLAFLLTDQAFAASIRRFNAGSDPHAGGMHFLGGGFALWLFWQITNLLGYFVGNLIPSRWSLDFAVPLCFIALLAPHFRSAPTITAAVIAGFFVITLEALPMKLALIAAGILGIVAGTLADFANERWTRR
jgi:predicted branched-subunit amino acid permease